MIGYIPARGGSKRTPGKNWKLFNGRPLIAWAVDLLQTVCDKVFVLTDSEEIAEAAEDCFLVIKEPPEIANFIPGREGGGAAAKYFCEVMNLPDDTPILNYMCTSPLVYRNDLRRMMSAFNELRTPVSLVAEMKECCLGHVKDGTDAGFVRGIEIDNGLPDGEKCKYVLPLIGCTITYIKYMMGKVPQLVPTYAIKAKQWQQFDIDWPEDFELCEYLHRKYILNEE